MIDTLIQHHQTIAGLTLAFALITVVWKTVGLAFIPGYEELFGDAPEAYYPRRVAENENAWHWFYFVMYGVFGTAAQLAGFLMILNVLFYPVAYDSERQYRSKCDTDTTS